MPASVWNSLVIRWVAENGGKRQRLDGKLLVRGRITVRKKNKKANAKRKKGIRRF